MFILKELTADSLWRKITDLIESEQDLTVPRHVKLTQYLNELSVIGFPPLVEACQRVLSGDQRWISQPLLSVLERVCSSVSKPHKEVPQRFEMLEEDHLLDQLKAILGDMKSMSLLKLQDEVDQLRDHLVLTVTHWLMKESEEKRDDRLRRILINTSEILGDALLLTPELFHETSISMLVEGLHECCLAGGALSIVLPGTDDEAQITHLKESEVLSNLRGVDTLIIDGYGAMRWLKNEVKQGLSEVRAIDLKVLGDDELLELIGSELFTQVEIGVNDREMRGELSSELMIKLENRFEELRLSDEKRISALLVAEQVSSLVVSNILGVEFKMVYCPAGEFWMGLRSDISDRREQPRHRVKITQPFLISQTQITQAQWQLIRGCSADWSSKNVSWFDCIWFCNELSEYEGLDSLYNRYGRYVEIDLSRTGYRLPTEAEWEYMMKAGTEWLDDGDEATWRESTTRIRLAPVDGEEFNRWGVYHGPENASEWCSDRWDEYAYYGRIGTINDPHEWTDSASSRAQRGIWNYCTSCQQIESRSGDDSERRRNISFRVLKSHV